MTHKPDGSARVQSRRALIVALFLLLSAIVSAPDLRRTFGHPLGLLGISFDYNGAVPHVEPQAERSGVQIGDHIDLARATPDQRYGYISIGTPEAYQRLQIPMLRGNVRYVATLTTYPESSDRIPMIWLRCAVQLFVWLIAAVVLLRKPSPATWGFFLLMSAGCAAVNDFYLLGPLWLRTITTNAYWVVWNDAVTSYGAIFFALYLLHDGPLPRWRRITQNVAIAAATVAFAMAIWHANALLFAPWPDPAGAVVYSILGTLPLFVAPLVLIATYFESSPNLRARLRWIIAGFLLSALCSAIDQAGSGQLSLFSESYLTHSLLLCGVYLFVALPVAYAILKHRIIDVNVAISRATAYTALSIIVIGVFALVDLFFTRALDQKSAGLVADVALALILGFSFNTMHRRVDSFVDRTLFRKRHLAEEYIAGVADAMAYAHDEPHVRSMLEKEPARAFDLTGARIISDVENSGQDVKTLGSYLEARRKGVRVSDGQWNLDAAVAIPLFSHGKLDAIILYGSHNNGTELDSEEVALLQRLASSAGSALDRLETETLRKEVLRLRRT
jgi:hypothetical protein